MPGQRSGIVAESPAVLPALWGATGEPTMTIRTKLFLTLLLFSLVPLLVVVLVGRGNWSAVRTDLSESTRGRIMMIAEDTRRHLVQKHAAILERDRALIEIDVRAAAEALRRIDSVGPAEGSRGVQLFTSADFDDPERRPTDLAPDPSAMRIAADGTRTPLLVSRDTPVFVPPPGVEIESLRDEAERLHSLVSTFQSVREDTPGQITPTTQYVALAGSKLHMSWPGKGGYPEDFDPHRRAWYQQAITNDTAVQWTRAAIDAPTGQVRFTCTAPVRRHNGTLIGVVAADILLSDVLRELDLPDAFADQAEAMLVVASADGPRVPRILASADYSRKAGNQWDSTIALEPVFGELDDGGTIGAELGDAMRDDEKDSVTLVVGGEPWIWTWERLPDGATYVLVGISEAAADAAAVEVANTIDAGIGTTLRQSLAVIGVVIIGVVVVGLWGSSSISRPVQTLALTAQAIADGDLTARADVRTRDELQTLAESFNSMVPKLEDRVRVLESLGIAREVQQHLLPRETPDIPGVDIAALCVYSDETGGDYYDFFEVDGDHHAVLLGDVTGHGIGAALLMTTARALIHARAPESADLPAVMGAVNSKLAEDSQSGQFMTLFYLLLSPGKRSVRWTSAGHDAAIVLDLDSGAFTELTGEDIPLGIDGSWAYHDAGGELPERSIVVIGTDGIWEARDPSGEMFGKERLGEIISANSDRSAEEIAAAILDAVVTFRAGGIQTDDITLVVLRFGDTASP